MPRKSIEELTRRNIRRLIDHATNHLELQDLDAIYVENELLNFFGVTEPYTDDIGQYELYQVLGELFDVAVKKKLYLESDRLLFEGRVMGTLMPRPMATIERFDNIAAHKGSREAAKWLQSIEEHSTYLRRPDLDKNIKWEHENTQRGNVIVTINLAKPEKTAEEIERAKNAKTGYPKCVLCGENIGHYGNAAQPARQHIRTIPLELNGEDWFMQFSPYEYFPEHIIAISREHRPMKLTGDSFKRMVDFVDLFPDYFLGSNAPLPIVGGSVLAHDHYQGGSKALPVFNRPARKHYLVREYPNCNVSIVDWYNSIVRIEGKNKNQVTALAEKFRSAWDTYTDESVGVIACTTAQHNTVTPIAYLNSDGEYTIILILRNNRTDDTHPHGIFHPTADMHNIKQESIGIIEAMGLFILPGRLAKECAQIKDILTGTTPLDFKAISEDGHPLNKHLGMIAQLTATNGTAMKDKEAGDAITDYINQTCEKILDCTAVFKCDEQGQTSFDKFIHSVID
ncbi:MAG: galactose-1-phosphate uridylyltransferase [Clostridia bacterium]|nr:galactose-1-phosphate uridylyltransferase [Clostridia bacterium]